MTGTGPRRGAVGVDVPRVDGPAIVRGAVRYTADITLPGMLRARVLRSPYPRAALERVDASRAASLPGVAAVLTRDQLGDLDPYFGSVVRDQPIVAVDQVRHVGDPVAAVVAEDLDVAEEALDLIAVDYRPLPAVLDVVEAMRPDAPVVHDRPLPRPGHFKDPNLYHYQIGGNVLMSYRVAQGDVEAGFRAADEVFEDTYRTPVAQHAHMEPHVATAYWEPDGKLVVLTPCQNPWVVRDQLAQFFGLEGSRVRVIVPPIGGGYGAKTHPRLEPLVAVLARMTRRPVQLALTREEVFATAVRHASVVRIRTGVMRDGTLVARRVETIYDTGAYAHTGPMTTKSGGIVSSGPYRIEHLELTSYCVYTNKPPAGPFRGFGVPQVAWAHEQQMDEIARRLGIDPVEIRLRNLVREGDTFVSGQPMVSVGATRCLEAVVDGIGWRPEAPRPVPGSTVRAKGVACAIKTTMTPSNSAASVRLNADGSAILLTSSTEMGQGVRTSLAQVVAQELGIAPSSVTVVPADTDVTPFDTSTSSSRSMFSMGNAALESAREIGRQLRAIAAEVLEADPRDIELAEGTAYVRGAFERGVRFTDLFRHRFGTPVGSLFGSHDFQTTGGLDPETGKGHATAFFFHSACAAEVEVDLDTGEVDVVRIVVSADVGNPINPRQCHLQNEGSMIMGLGTALFEEMAFDDGQPINSSFVEYAIPSMRDHPGAFSSLLVAVPHPDGPFGAKGAGEAAIPAIAPAIANAVARAVGGGPSREMPMLPWRVRDAIERAAGTPYGDPAAQ